MDDEEFDEFARGLLRDVKRLLKDPNDIDVLDDLACTAGSFGEECSRRYFTNLLGSI